ncbi:MAG: TonB-dependent receptor domain-containing protein [Longimicrobiaceae bacterium]
MSKGSALLLLVAGMTFFPAGARAQTGDLYGTVRDAATGAPVAGARVAIGGEAGDVSDEQGRFRISGLSKGAKQVLAEAFAYEAVTRTVEVRGAGSVRLDLRLRPAALEIPQIEVIGSRSKEALARIPGSAALIGTRELRERVPLSGNEVLKSVPGVHVQEEEGAGLRANIGIRGLAPDRSRTVLVLEDGVPVALNPYGEPEMYYTPPIDRMSRVEVVKGSGSILFGPQTIGGVINYVTPDPPLEPQTSARVQGGGGGYFNFLGRAGGSWQNVGANLSLLRKQANNLRGLLFEVTDVTGKVGFGLGGSSELGVKLSVYDEVSNSTYVGLTEQMFLDDPDRHPNPDDRLRIRRYAGSITHEAGLGAGARLTTTAYGYTTSRNWQRQDYSYQDGGSRLSFEPSTGNRNRSFEVAGIEPRLQWNHAFFGVPGELDAGLRFHAERAYDSRVNGSTPTSRTGVIRDYEIRTGTAFSAFVQNRVHLFPGFRVTPGLRFEAFEYERNILRARVRRLDPGSGEVTRAPEDVDIRSGGSLSELIPGLGVSWLPSDRITVFAGAHRGFSPPRVKDALVFDDRELAPGERVGDPVSLELDAEESWNFELGTRAHPAAGVYLELTGFLLDFTNQIIAPSLSAGSVAQAELANQGETRHAGVESAWQADWGEILAWPFSLTTGVNHTYVDAVFAADRLMESAAGDTVNVRGNRLPYAPEQLLNVSVDFDHPAGYGFRLDGTHVGEQFADNFETAAPLANGRNGLIPAYEVWNLSARYRFTGGAELFATVKNLFDATYIASRRPEGIKPGLPRLLNLGVRASF